MADPGIHISEAAAASNFTDLLARVQSGKVPVAVLRPVGEDFRPRLLSESIALAKNHAEELGYEPTLDPDFAADLEQIIKSRKPREISSWE